MDLLTPGTTFASLVDKILAIFDKLVPVLVVAALLFFFWGVIKYITHRGESEKRNFMIWSLVALFIILSVWGILRLACASLLGDSSCSGGGGYASSQSYSGGDGFSQFVNSIPPPSDGQVHFYTQ